MQSFRLIRYLGHCRAQPQGVKVLAGRAADSHSHTLHARHGDTGITGARTAGFAEVAGNRLDRESSLHDVICKFKNHIENLLTLLTSDEKPVCLVSLQPSRKV
jgi:hypothetical protein